jgi:hypothetical protein
VITSQLSPPISVHIQQYPTGEDSMMRQTPIRKTVNWGDRQWLALLIAVLALLASLWEPQPNVNWNSQLAGRSEYLAGGGGFQPNVNWNS